MVATADPARDGQRVRAAPPFDPWQTAQIAADVLATSAASAEAIDDRQRQRLAALLRAAARHSPYFGRLFGSDDPARLSLADLPVTHKRTLMAAFEDWVAAPANDLRALNQFVADPSRIASPFLDRYVVWESSGSTGAPAVFVQDAAAMAVYDALEGLRRPAQNFGQRWLDPFGLNERQVFIGALGGHFASTVSIERLRRLNPLLGHTVRSLSFLLPAAELVEQLAALDPTVIATYPTAAVLLASEQRAGRLSIRPREIWTGGEDLSPAMRHHVSETFGCPVIESYGASEFLTLATACREGRLHLNSDWAILEPVDVHGRLVPDGVLSHTALLTNLANHVQPIIRYDLGDRVAMHRGPCACGSALPAISVQGRDETPIILGTTSRRSVTLLPLALVTVLEEEAGLFDFQLVRRGPRDLVLHCGPDVAGAEAALRRGREALLGFLAKHGVTGVRIACRSDTSLVRGRSGKIGRILTSEPGGHDQAAG
jgi:phenylacetate-coenzyme A ligase PaaK-like adenylate-forming protein